MSKPILIKNLNICTLNFFSRTTTGIKFILIWFVCRVTISFKIKIMFSIFNLQKPVVNFFLFHTEQKNRFKFMRCHKIQVISIKRVLLAQNQMPLCKKNLPTKSAKSFRVRCYPSRYEKGW